MDACVSEDEPPSTICCGSVITTVLALTGTEDITIADIAAINIIETRLIDLILSLINRPLADRINKTILSSYLTATLPGHKFTVLKNYFMPILKDQNLSQKTFSHQIQSRSVRIQHLSHLAWNFETPWLAFSSPSHQLAPVYQRLAHKNT